MLALPILEAATRLLSEMATFAGAGVSASVDGSPEKLARGERG